MINVTGVSTEALERVILQHDVEQFLYREARLLDERRSDKWLDLLAGRIRQINTASWRVVSIHTRGVGADEPRRQRVTVEYTITKGEQAACC